MIDAAAHLEQLIESGQEFVAELHQITAASDGVYPQLKMRHDSWVRIARTTIMTVFDDADEILGSFPPPGPERRVAFDNFVADEDRVRRLESSLQGKLQILIDTRSSLDMYPGPGSDSAPRSASVNNTPDPVSRSRPRFFIASSRESMNVASAIQANLYRDAEGTPWYEGFFEISTFTLESLESKIPTFDFGVFGLCS